MFRVSSCSRTGDLSLAGDDSTCTVREFDTAWAGVVERGSHIVTRNKFSGNGMLGIAAGLCLARVLR